MITHIDESGNEVELLGGKHQTENIKQFMFRPQPTHSIIKDYIVFFDSEEKRICLKHSSGKIIKMYSETELIKKIR